MQVKTATLNGMHIAYTNQTEFLVEVGRGPKGSYATRYRFVGDLQRAVLHFNGINIGYGYKKRLTMVGGNKPVLARAFSYFS